MILSFSSLLSRCASSAYLQAERLEQVPQARR
jgi:hypothetical protein